GSYSYTFNGVTNSTGVFNNIPAGTYTWSVTDGKSCAPATGSVTVTEPVLITATENHTVIDCNGGSSTVTLTANGGNGNYSYTLGAQTNSTGVFNNIAAGTYNWSVTDGKSCAPATGSVTISQPAKITAIESHTVIDCNGGNSIVTLTAQGGNGNYQYTLGTQTNSTGIFNNIPAGTYTWSVTDGKSCAPATGNVTISQPAKITATENHTAIDCNGGSSTVTLIAQGGNGSYQYTLGAQTNSTGIFNNIAAGTYTWSVTDGKSCAPATGNVTISQPAKITATENHTVIDCNGGSSTVTLTAQGGNGNYQYTLGTQTNTTGIFNNIPAGTYSWSVTDGKNCAPATGSITIAEPTIITATESHTVINCNGGTSTITLVANGGNGNYQYTLGSQSNITGVFTNVRAGTYNWSVRDAKGCLLSNKVVVINEPLPISNNIISDNQTVYAHEVPSKLTGSLPTGESNSFVYQWQQSLTGDNGSFVDIPGATAKDYQPGKLKQTTYFRRIVRSGSCTLSISNIIKITIIASADIVTVKSTDQRFYVPGETVTYTIKIKNNGPSDAEQVHVIERVPAQTILERWWAVVQGSVNLPRDNGSITLDEVIPLLPDGAEVTYTVVLRVPLNYTGVLKNTVDVSSPTTDPDPTCGACTTPGIPTEPEADLVFSKSLKNTSQQLYTPGEDVIYLIKVTNYGPGDARNVRIVDVPPPGTTIKSWKIVVLSGNPQLARISGNGNLDETIPLLPNGSSIAIEAVLQTPPDHTQRIVNMAKVTSPTPDPNPNPDAEPGCAECVKSPPLDPYITIDLSMLKIADLTPITVGTEFEYKLEVKNNSLFIAHDVVATDVIPNQVTYIPDLQDRRIEYDDKTRTLTWKIGVLNAGNKEIVTLKVRTESLGLISNTASVTGSEPDLNLLNNSSTAIKNSVVLKVPNVITPNGDGKNDVLKIVGIELYKENTLSIFNRWGNEVYRSKGYKNDWDGRGLSEGTYYYVLTYSLENGTKQSVTGYIMLLRD
ncbi:T9SS type B sorting domain-containing protein, partial [Pedobacter montanisoli]